ncbi:MAG: hypothetical protein CBC29_06525 [Methylococcaceae bacterium TMED69]|mgnify:FL=1|nr:MAG: hypothetical protein CBC29_06525 [Methylococcaceae bacterium TMED69]|tara:strand:- start:556 stop:1302 length:747 start_codon:yes stop_codon:yes gene_type:complete
MKITKGQLRNIIRESLWANIHAKKKRGEKSDPRSKSYQAAKKAGQKINREKKNEADDTDEGYMTEVDKDGDGSPARPKWAEEKGITPKWADPDDDDPKKTAKLKKEAKHLAQYKPKQKSIRGMTRGEALDKTKEDLASGDPKRKERAYRRRAAMEKAVNENKFREMIREILSEALSKATEDKIRKKAEERGMTFGSMKAEYKKGLAAWGSSGSKPGMSQHAWAMARINKANPSDDWSVVKKSKARKKK